VITTRDAARQQAAWKFVQFLTGEQAFTTLTTEIGYLPLRPDVVTNQKYLAKYFKADKRLLPALSQLNSVTTYTFFRGPNATQAVAALQDDAVTPIALRGQAAQPVLSKVANTIRNLVGE
jgi:multiple sugar transport system substrate-binding protein